MLLLIIVLRILVRAEITRKRTCLATTQFFEKQTPNFQQTPTLKQTPSSKQNQRKTSVIADHSKKVDTVVVEQDEDKKQGVDKEQDEDKEQNEYKKQNGVMGQE